MATYIASQMYSEKHITEEEEYNIQRQENLRAKTVELIMCVLRKNCAAEFIYCMKMLEIPKLYSLAITVEEHIKNCGKVKIPGVVLQKYVMFGFDVVCYFKLYCISY